MNITLFPTRLSGSMAAIASKSQAHRLLICGALADCPTTLICPQTSQDIAATAECLRALGAEITPTDMGYRIAPIGTLPEQARLFCRESGSTLRFLLPLVGALGVQGLFQLEGRLPRRPLSPLWEVMEEKGCRLSRPTPSTLLCAGQLCSGTYTIDGGISSQFTTGLLLALSTMKEESRLTLTGKVESLPYIEMTLDALTAFGQDISRQGQSFHLRPRPFHSPGTLEVEGDWSNAAFWLTANALGNSVAVSGLNPHSRQGDRAVVDCLRRMEKPCDIDVAQIPDLVPILAVAAGAGRGARFYNAGRLRLKETDRLETTRAMLLAIGGEAEIQDDALIVHPTGYTGGTVDATGDHRIAMAAAIAATVSTGPIIIVGAQAVQKSYPAFWQDYQALGGKL